MPVEFSINESFDPVYPKYYLTNKGLKKNFSKVHAEVQKIFIGFALHPQTRANSLKWIKYLKT